MVPQTEDSQRKPQSARFRFHLWHLFVITTVFALAWGVVTWIGPLGLMLACGPLVTWIVLDRTDGDSLCYAVLFGAAVQALLIASLLLIMFVLLSEAPLERLAALAVLSALIGMIGGFVSIVVSPPIVGLWYATRSIRRTGEREEVDHECSSA